MTLDLCFEVFAIGIVGGIFAKFTIDITSLQLLKFPKT